MPKMKPVSGIKVVKALGEAGFQVVGRRGSHVRLKKKTQNTFYIVIVPLHPEIKKGTLKSILRQSGLSDEEFNAFLEK